MGCGCTGLGFHPKASRQVHGVRELMSLQCSKVPSNVGGCDLAGQGPRRARTWNLRGWSSQAGSRQMLTEHLLCAGPMQGTGQPACLRCPPFGEATVVQTGIITLGNSQVLDAAQGSRNLTHQIQGPPSGSRSPQWCDLHEEAISEPLGLDHT